MCQISLIESYACHYLFPLKIHVGYRVKAADRPFDVNLDFKIDVYQEVMINYTYHI
jgi:hypothetical protein